MAKVACYLLYGLGGRTWSAGIADKLGPKVRVLPNVWCPPTYQWGDWNSIVENIKANLPDTKIVIAGHSLGANVIGYIAQAVPNRSIDLVIGYDPSIWYPVPKLPKTVRKAICFHGMNWLNPIGHALYSGSQNLVTYNTWDLHTNIDDDNDLHAIAVKEIKTLL